MNKPIETRQHSADLVFNAISLLIWDLAVRTDDPDIEREAFLMFRQMEELGGRHVSDEIAQRN